MTTTGRSSSFVRRRRTAVEIAAVSTRNSVRRRRRDPGCPRSSTDRHRDRRGDRGRDPCTCRWSSSRPASRSTRGRRSSGGESDVRDAGRGIGDQSRVKSARRDAAAYPWTETRWTSPAHDLDHVDSRPALATHAEANRRPPRPLDASNDLRERDSGHVRSVDLDEDVSVANPCRRGTSCDGRHHASGGQGSRCRSRYRSSNWSRNRSASSTYAFERGRSPRTPAMNVAMRSGRASRTRQTISDHQLHRVCGADRRAEARFDRPESIRSRPEPPIDRADDRRHAAVRIGRPSSRVQPPGPAAHVARRRGCRRTGDARSMSCHAGRRAEASPPAEVRAARSRATISSSGCRLSAASSDTLIQARLASTGRSASVSRTLPPSNDRSRRRSIVGSPIQRFGQAGGSQSTSSTRAARSSSVTASSSSQIRSAGAPFRLRVT